MFYIYIYTLLLLFMKKNIFLTLSFQNRFPRYLATLKSHTDIHNIHIINDNVWYKQNELDKFLYNNEFIQNKKLISISPGGYKGFYVLGICKYIKENYNLDDYIFSGASAGAWNSLLLCYKYDINNIIEQIVDNHIQSATSLYETEKIIKYKILTKYNSDNFDLRRLFIGVTTMQNYNYNTTIFTGFNNLEDAINCCIASSHIPLITGGLKHIYHNLVSFDGGFSKYPYLNITKPVLHITPSIWKKNQTRNNQQLKITDYTTLFSKSKFVFVDMVNNGYNDASENKDILDKIFLGN